MAFKRRIEVSIGQVVEFGPQVANPTNAVIINDNLKITFKILKTIEKSNNSATVSIYNLSQNTIERIKRPGSFMIVRAGYEDEDGPQQIFLGNITGVAVKNLLPDIATEITASDGALDIRQKKAALSYTAGIDLSTVITDIVDILQMTVRYSSPVPPLQYIHAFAFAGLAIDALRKALDFAGMTFTINGNELFIFVPGEAVEALTLNISPTTGLVRSPELLIETKDAPAMSEAAQKYKVTSLLFPQLTPGKLFNLQSNIVSGTFKINSVEFKGDNWGQDFNANMEVEQI